MAPLRPLRQFGCMVVHCYPYSWPLHRRESITQIEVENGDRLVLDALCGLLEAPSQVHQSVCTSWQGDAALPMGQKEALQMVSLIGRKPLGDDSAPYFPDANWPGRVGAWLPQEDPPGRNRKAAVTPTSPQLGNGFKQALDPRTPLC